jgi:hypothetical protein
MFGSCFQTESIVTNPGQPRYFKHSKPAMVNICEAWRERIAFGPAESNLTPIIVRIVRSYFEESILNKEERHHADTNKWRPVIVSFYEFHGLGGNLHESRLAKVF